MGMGYLKGQSDLTSKNMLLIISHNEKIPGTKDCCECFFLGGKSEYTTSQDEAALCRRKSILMGIRFFFCFVLDTGYEK